MAAGEREFVYCGQRALNAVDPLFEQCHRVPSNAGRYFLASSSVARYDERRIR